MTYFSDCKSQQQKQKCTIQTKKQTQRTLRQLRLNVPNSRSGLLFDPRLKLCPETLVRSSTHKKKTRYKSHFREKSATLWNESTKPGVTVHTIQASYLRPPSLLQLYMLVFDANLTLKASHF